ncbi:MAG TPA: aspartyl-phosphate phosphatase Spo0E family protein [Chondromyces sp.]|nr:aspartyl-phosphate phosphatase Spo0E family protein [Chondromyces sp.]
MGVEELAEKIRLKREEMIQCGLLFGLSARETVSCSQELDCLLNEFHHVKDFGGEDSLSDSQIMKFLVYKEKLSVCQTETY